MSEAPFRLGPIRWISVVTFAAWLALVAVSYGYVESFEYAWGLNLFRYQPDWIAWLLTGLALLFATEETRNGLIRAGRWIAEQLTRLSQGSRDGLLLGAALAFLWICRERVLLGDSVLLASVLHAPQRLAIAETGSVLVMHELYRAAMAVGLPGIQSTQLVMCALGAAAVVLLTRAARLATPEGRGAACIPLLVFSGGIAAALAGRIETQALAIAASSLYLWRALRFLSGEGGLTGPALALGVAAWLQPACLLLLPGLLLLPRWTGRGRVLPALGLALLPLALHVALFLAVNPRGLPFATVVSGVLGWAQGWVRLWGGRSSLGTDYVMLSRGHLKYLANAAFVLHPIVLPLGMVLLAAFRRRLFASPAASFVAVSTAGLVITAFTIRPVWGPFDWDLFAVPALFTAFAVGMGVARIESRSFRTHVAIAGAGLQIFFVGIPMLGIGQGASIEAGPLVLEKFELRLNRTGKRPPRHIAPWL